MQMGNFHNIQYQMLRLNLITKKNHPQVITIYYQQK